QRRDGRAASRRRHASPLQATRPTSKLNHASSSPYIISRLQNTRVILDSGRARRDDNLRRDFRGLEKGVRIARAAESSARLLQGHRHSHSPPERGAEKPRPEITQSLHTRRRTRQNPTTSPATTRQTRRENDRDARTWNSGPARTCREMVLRRIQ